MKVYITDLEAYNNGHLVGAWYELPMNENLLAESIENELQKGKNICNSTHHHEEYFITDSECDYMKIDEYESLTKLNEIAQKMNSFEIQERTAVKLMLENYILNSIDEAIENIDNMICTGEDNMEDVAYNYIEESGALQGMAESLQGYFDYDGLGRDMELEGSYFRDGANVLWEFIR